jgi:hypothetical protein
MDSEHPNRSADKIKKALSELNHLKPFAIFFL